jgi:hypothetical protein
MVALLTDVVVPKVLRSDALRSQRLARTRFPTSSQKVNRTPLS